MKKNKSKGRRVAYLPIYSKLDIMVASSTEPMPEEFRTHQLNRMNGGLHAMTHAPEPTTDDWRVVSDAVNLLETIVELGWAEDAQGLLPDAVKALAEAGTRHLKGAPLRLSGPGLAAVRGVLQDYEAVLCAVSERNMKFAHAQTERRIFDIRRGKIRVGDAVITKI